MIIKRIRIWNDVLHMIEFIYIYIFIYFYTHTHPHTHTHIYIILENMSEFLFFGRNVTTIQLPPKVIIR
jgi:hypothetical protein